MLDGFLSILLNALIVANVLAVSIYVFLRWSGGGGGRGGKDCPPPEPCPRPPGKSMRRPVRQTPLNGEQDPVPVEVLSEEVFEVASYPSVLGRPV